MMMEISTHLEATKAGVCAEVFTAVKIEKCASHGGHPALTTKNSKYSTIFSSAAANLLAGVLCGATTADVRPNLEDGKSSTEQMSTVFVM
jgi:hypothetical protein